LVLKCLKGVDEMGTNKRRTIKEVEGFFESIGYVLITDCYINNKQELEYICLNHKDKGVQKTTFNSISRGRRCRLCSYEERGKKHSEYMKERYTKEVVWNKYDIEYAREYFDSCGLVLETDEYIGVMEPMECSCPIHHNKPNQFIRLNDLQKPDVKFGCRWCGIEARSAENSYLWQGGISSENHIARTCGEALRFKKDVLERDNYTCQCCGANRLGSNRTKLSVHHKYNFSTHKHLRYDIDNGITLCADCHDTNVPGSFHSIYGVLNNTPEQLEEYIRNKRKEKRITG
jgi:hypothetical protein